MPAGAEASAPRRHVQAWVALVNRLPGELAATVVITLSFRREKECEFPADNDSDNWNAAPLRLLQKLTAILAFAS